MESNVQISTENLISDDSSSSFLNETAPPELFRVVNGIANVWIGGFLNDGISEWIGVDFDRNERFFVSRSCRPPLQDIQKLTQRNPDKTFRKVSVGRLSCIEQVRILPLPKDDLQNLLSLINSLVSQVKTQSTPVFKTGDTLLDTTILRVNGYREEVLDEWLDHDKKMNGILKFLKNLNW
jgi:hypothetical protein